MKFVLVNFNSKVENIIEADQQFADSIKDDWLVVLNLEDFPNTNIGDLWNGSTFSPPPLDYDFQWKIIREMRDQKLQESDWTQFADVPLTPEQRAEWVTYRQELRNVTNQPDPFHIIWPVEPNDS
jgi:hypothetical protein